MPYPEGLTQSQIYEEVFVDAMEAYYHWRDVDPEPKVRGRDHKVLVWAELRDENIFDITSWAWCTMNTRKLTTLLDRPADVPIAHLDLG